jgi:hypothetical protein
MILNFPQKWLDAGDDTDNMNPTHKNSFFKGYEDGCEKVF